MLLCSLVWPLGFLAHAADAPRGAAWRSMAPAPSKRTEVAAAAVNGRIHVLGGFAAPSLGNLASLLVSNAVEVYDPGSDQWTTAAPLPTRLHHAGAASIGGHVYVVGGFTTSFLSLWTPVATAYRYDPSADTWEELAPMPTARGALALAALGGKLYAVGGIGNDGNTSAVEMYDPTTQSWSAKASLPTARDHLAAAVVGTRLYAIGGRLKGSYSNNLGVMEVYDPAGDRWTTASPLPTPRSGIAAGVIDNIIYVVGGEAPEGTFQTAEAYSAASDRWWTVPPMPTGRHGLGAAVVGRYMFVIAGGPSPGGSFSNLNERYDPGSLKTSRASGKRASPAHIGAVMAVLATFDEAGVLPPESSPDASTLIRALIQFQSAFLKSDNQSVREFLNRALRVNGAGETDNAVDTFRRSGWTSHSLEAVVEYATAHRVWADRQLVVGFRAYNVGLNEFELISRTFFQARSQLASEGRDFHQIYAGQRLEMPGSRM